jgi:CheY-like chemotaxis protein
MRILVIDDLSEQREHAKQALVGHEVMTANGWKDGAAAIESGGWDAVLTDLSMPGEGDGQGDGRQYVGQQTPYGFALAMLALKFGISKIAVVSNGQADANHHSHPIYWASDSLHGEIIPGRLWVFAGYDCPHMEKVEGNDKPWRIKDWAAILETVTK